MRNGSAHGYEIPFCPRALKALAMPIYRCYLLNYSDNIVSVDSLQADEDNIAMVMATSLLRQQHPTSAAMEVWDQSRRLGRIDNSAPGVSTLRSLLGVKNA
jgi:hypothetical protein